MSRVHDIIFEICALIVENMQNYTRDQHPQGFHLCKVQNSITTHKMMIEVEFGFFNMLAKQIDVIC